MLVAVHSFASIWSSRAGATAFYNTTGVLAGGRVRHRSCVYGYARFDAAGGFNRQRLSRMTHRVFECDQPCIWNGAIKMRFRRLLSSPERPHRFLVAITSDCTGMFDRDAAWKSDDSLLISFSEFAGSQEALLLMPAYGWVRGTLGTFCLEPDRARPWRSALPLIAAATEESR